MKKLLLVFVLLLNNQFIAQRAMAQTYVIPVVFHILHQGGSENISDAQVLDAMTRLNSRYSALADTSIIEPAFRGVIGDPDIEFRLATIDPLGNCTDGIDRIQTSLTNNANDCSKLNQWDPAHYLNIWVVRSLESAGLAYYTYLPSTAAMPAYQPYDGIIILHNYVGSIGTGSFGGIFALTQAAGHFLGLPDPGTACNDGDGIADTPPTDGSFFCAQDSSCNASVHENYQNFMSFSYCQAMFTDGQVNAMHFTLNSSLANRDQLCTPANLLATGVTSPGAACAPKADFVVNRKLACVGTNFQFTDLSSLGTPTSWNWSFTGPGGTTTSTVANPLISFTTPGMYETSLAVGNAAGSTTKTKTEYFYVANGFNDLFGPNLYDFENAADFYSKFPIFNIEENISEWQHTTTAAYSGSSSLMLNAYDICGADRDELITASYDLSTTSAGVLKFRYSGAVTDTSLSNGTLKVYASKTCGQIWQLMGTKTGADLSPAGVNASSFVPAGSFDWTEFSFLISPTMNASNVRFKLEFTGGAGVNNIYIDDFKIEGTLGVEENYSHREGNLFPNPTANTFTYEQELSNSEKGRMEISDITGKVVCVNELETEKTTIDVSAYSEGIYFCKIFINDKEVDRKKLILIK